MNLRVIAASCLAIILALVVGVGLASGLVLRHVVQTLPLCVGAALAVRHVRAAGWLTLPCFLFWLVLMAIIWLYLLDVAQLINGHFTPVEIAMTLVVAAASCAGIVTAGRTWRSAPAGVVVGLFTLGAAIQWICFRVSMLPGIAHR